MCLHASCGPSPGSAVAIYESNPQRHPCRTPPKEVQGSSQPDVTHEIPDGSHAGEPQSKEYPQASLEHVGKSGAQRRLQPMGQGRTTLSTNQKPRPQNQLAYDQSHY